MYASAWSFWHYPSGVLLSVEFYPNFEDTISTRPKHKVTVASPQRDTYSAESNTAAMDQEAMDSSWVQSISPAWNWSFIIDQIAINLKHEVLSTLQVEELNCNTLGVHFIDMDARPADSETCFRQSKKIYMHHSSNVDTIFDKVSWAVLIACAFRIIEPLKKIVSVGLQWYFIP